MGLLDGADAVLFDLDDTLLDYSTARDAGRPGLGAAGRCRAITFCHRTGIQMPCRGRRLEAAVRASASTPGRASFDGTPAPRTHLGLRAPAACGRARGRRASTEAFAAYFARRGVVPVPRRCRDGSGAGAPHAGQCAHQQPAPSSRPAGSWTASVPSFDLELPALTGRPPYEACTELGSARWSYRHGQRRARRRTSWVVVDAAGHSVRLWLSRASRQCHRRRSSQELAVATGLRWLARRRVGELPCSPY